MTDNNDLWLTVNLDDDSADSAREVVERSHVAMGFARGEQLDERALVGAPLPVVSQWLFDRGAAEAALVRSSTVDGVFALDPEGFSTRATNGVRALPDGRLAIDARTDPQRVLLEGPSVRLLLAIGLDEVRAVSLGVPALPLSVPAAPVLPEVCAMPWLLGERVAPPWLVDKFSIRSQGSLYSRAVAIASVARLCPAASTLAAFGAAAVDRVLAGDTPDARAGAWLSALPTETRSALVVAAQQECDALRDGLDILMEHCAEDSAGGARIATQWLERRDDLESVSILLRNTDGVAQLRDDLAQLDEQARSLASTWDALAPEWSEQLQCSASEDPGTWWTEER